MITAMAVQLHCICVEHCSLCCGWVEEKPSGFYAHPLLFVFGSHGQGLAHKHELACNSGRLYYLFASSGFLYVGLDSLRYSVPIFRYSQQVYLPVLFVCYRFLENHSPRLAWR